MQDENELSRDEQLYDEYLDALLEGGALTPAEFCAQHGVVGGALMRRLEGLWAMSAATRVPENGSSVEGATVTEPGTVLGDYRLIERLGGGGMGVVHRARQLSLDREVAVKVMTANLQTSPVGLERFLREARALASVRHASVVSVHDCDEHDGVRFLVMELVEGEGLDIKLAGARQTDSRLPARMAVRWFAQLARALDAAHAEGIIHRDVKPSNILIATDGRPVLIDFGLARDLDAESITMTETFMGSPQYAAPEQVLARHGEMDGRSDVYSLGATLYECLTGASPFAGGTIEQVFHKILLDDPRPPRALNPEVSRDLEVVTLKAMAKEPAERYQSAAALAEDLEALLEFRPISARPPSAWTRAMRWTRRNPGGASAIIMGILAVVAVVVALGLRARQLERERLEGARAEMVAAGNELEALSQARVESRELEAEVRELERALGHRFVTPEGYDALANRSSAAAAAQRARLDRFYAVLEHVRRAQQLDAGVEGVDPLLARLYMEKFEEAIENDDRLAGAAYRQAVTDHDPAGALAERLVGWGELSVTTTPSGASVRAFLYREQSALFEGGDERLVPVPLRDGRIDTGGMLRPGTWVLEVRESGGGLRRGDLVLEIAGAPIEGTVFVTRSASGDVQSLDRVVAVDDAPITCVFDALTCGGVTAQERESSPRPYRFRFERGAPDGPRLFEIETTSLEAAGIVVATPGGVVAESGAPGKALRGGVLVDVELPAGLSTRTTAAPCDLDRAEVLGPTPVVGHRVEPGDLLLLIELEGHESQRVPLHMPRGGQRAVHVDLLPEGMTPAGFVPVLDHLVEPTRRFWMQEFEVTAAEWLEFLDDPAVRADVDASSVPVLFPRGSNNTGDNFWSRDADGRFHIEPPFRPDWPVLGISFEDAVAYAAWRTRRAQQSGLPHRYALPDHREWQIAAGQAFSDRAFVYGNRFRPRWTKTCFSRRFADPEPVGSFPIDESPFGVRDVGGSAFEWLDAWWEERKGSRRLAGGAWGQATRSILRLGAGFGMAPQRTTGETGLRLALHVDGLR